MISVSGKKFLKYISGAVLLLISQAPSAVLAACNTPCTDIICNPICYPSIPALIDAVITFVMVIAMMLVPLMIVWAGILYVTSAGDTEKTQKAKDVIKYTVLGALIVLMSKGIIAAIKGVIGG